MRTISESTSAPSRVLHESVPKKEIRVHLFCCFCLVMGLVPQPSEHGVAGRGHRKTSRARGSLAMGTRCQQGPHCMTAYECTNKAKSADLVPTLAPLGSWHGGALAPTEPTSQCSGTMKNPGPNPQHQRARSQGSKGLDSRTDPKKTNSSL